MAVAVEFVRVVGVAVRQRFVPMRMAMAGPDSDRGLVLVPVVFVVAVFVVVQQRGVGMCVFVALGQV